MSEDTDILKESPATYRAAAVEVRQTGKPMVVERQGDLAVAVLPWDAFQAFEKWYEEQERERLWQEQAEAFEREVMAFAQMKEELLKKYKGQYVAVYQGEVVGVGPDKLGLASEMYEKFGAVPMFVHLVAEKDPVYGMPSLKVISRLE